MQSIHRIFFLLRHLNETFETFRLIVITLIVSILNFTSSSPGLSPGWGTVIDIFLARHFTLAVLLFAKKG